MEFIQTTSEQIEGIEWAAQIKHDQDKIKNKTQKLVMGDMTLQ